MSDAQNANEEFDALWEAVSKGRVIVGDEDHGVEVALDIDLSPLGLLKQVRDIADFGHAHGFKEEEAEKSVGELEPILSRLKKMTGRG